MVSAVAGNVVTGVLGVLCMGLAITTAVLADAWFSISKDGASLKCGLFKCTVSLAGHSTSFDFPDFDCTWMNVVVKAWRGEAIAVAVFAFIAMALYFGAALKSADTSCMRTGGLVLMLLSMFLSAALAGSMMLIIEGNWGEDCMGEMAAELGASSMANVPGFTIGKGMYMMCASFALAIFASIAHCVTDGESASAPEGYQVYNASDFPAQTIQYNNSPMEKVPVAE